MYVLYAYNRKHLHSCRRIFNLPNPYQAENVHKVLPMTSTCQSVCYSRHQYNVYVPCTLIEWYGLYMTVILIVYMISKPQSSYKWWTERKNRACSLGIRLGEMNATARKSFTFIGKAFSITLNSSMQIPVSASYIQLTQNGCLHLIGWRSRDCTTQFLTHLSVRYGI